MPLAGSLGILALPDVPMALATVLCLDAGARLLREIDAASAAELALGLAIGALSHYRFVGVIGVGFMALLLLPQGRRVLRDPRMWVALALGIAAWAPLIAWNLENADAGLRFQLVDRHPWSFQCDGWWFLVVQAALVTPLLFFALIQVFVRSFGNEADEPAQWRYFGLLGGVSTLGFFALGFFADVERVSFHWPLPGYLPLAGRGAGVAPAMAARLAHRHLGVQRHRPGDRAGLLPDACRRRHGARILRRKSSTPPTSSAGTTWWPRCARNAPSCLPDTRLMADNFKSGAELGFAFGDARIEVLDHPLNHKHGRAPQLDLWGLQSDGTRNSPVLLVVGSSDVQYKSLLGYYHQLCGKVGPLPPPRVVNVDHGHQRFLLFALRARKVVGPCTAPAFAWIDMPESKAITARQITVSGWAFKDGVGLEGVDILVDGKAVAKARYGLSSPGTAAFWKISTDPNHPHVGFSAEVDLGTVIPGRHWLGLRLHGSDGSVEDWSEQPIEIVD